MDTILIGIYIFGAVTGGLIMMFIMSALFIASDYKKEEGE